MARRAGRGKESYYDPELVALVDGLFKSAALLQDGRHRIFVSDGNNIAQHSKVRQLFGIEANDIAIWRKGDWHKVGPTWPVDFIDRLAVVFSDDYMSIVNEGDAHHAELVHAYWCRTSPDDLERVRRDLAAHRLLVEKEIAGISVAGGRRRTNPPDSGVPESASIASSISAPLLHTDLTPPPFAHGVLREKELGRLAKQALENFAIVIEGRPKLGKRYLAYQHISYLPASTRPLWISLTPQSDFREVIDALALASPALATPIDRAISSIAGWLRSTDSMLVLAGLDAANIATFLPLLDALQRQPGPCRVIVTSSVKTNGLNTHEIKGLTGSEAIAVLELAGAKYDAEEVRSLASKVALSPALLRQAAARFGTLGRTELAIGMEDLHAGIVAGLPQGLREAYEVFQVLRVDLDLAVVAVVLAALEVPQTPAQVLAELERFLLLRRETLVTWRLEESMIEPLLRSLSSDRLREVLIAVAAFYRAKVEDDDGMPEELSQQNCYDLFAACRLLQLADHDDGQRGWLKRQFTSRLERSGAFRQLLPLYEYEAAATDDQWDEFRYARALFVLGRYDLALGVLDELFHDLVADRRARDESLYLSVLRLLAEILIEIGKPELATRILDGAFERAEISDLSYLVCTSSVSVLSWALVKSGMPEACLALNEEILDRNFQGLGTPFSKTISFIRRGVALRELGRLPESIEMLREACAFFTHEDARAFAWGAENLAISLHVAGDRDEAEKVLRSAMRVSASHDLANGEALSIYRFFADSGDYPDLKVALGAEIERLTPFEDEWLTIGEEIEESRLIEHLLLALDVDLSKPYEFDLTDYELLSFASPHAISARFNRTLVSRLREADLEQVLDEIFEVTAPESIFRKHLYNRVIVDACMDSVILTKKFVLPYLDVIKQQSDSVLFLYARLLEGSDQVEEAEALLQQVRNKESFSYYNIRANCASHSDPLNALKLNDGALRFAQRRQQRAQILHNKAHVVFRHDITYLFDDARAWCEEAIRQTNKKGFFWPRNLLLKLTLARSPIAEVSEVIHAHRRRFKTPMTALREIAEGLPRGRLRNAALRAIEDMA